MIITSHELSSFLLYAVIFIPHAVDWHIFFAGAILKCTYFFFFSRLGTLNLPNFPIFILEKRFFYSLDESIFNFNALWQWISCIVGEFFFS